MQGGSGWDAAAGAHPVADTVTTIGTVLITLSLDALRTGLGARIIPAVLDGESMPLDLGRARRLFTPAQAQGPRPARRRRVRLPGCDRLGSWCDTHNLTHWADGGATDLSNGVPFGALGPTPR